MFIMSMFQVCRLCIVWTRSADTSLITRLVRLKELLHDTSVVTTQIVFDINNSDPGLSQLQTWLLSTRQ